MNWTALYAILKNSINTTKAELEQEITEKIGLTNQFLDELPEAGESGVLYFIPKDDVDPSAEDQYFMYVWDPDNTEFVFLDPDMDMSPYAKTADLATVATSGAYSDLSGTPDLTPYITENEADDRYMSIDATKDKIVSGNPVTFETLDKTYLKSAKVTFEPKQDLHGYGYPWPAGGGKNKCPFFTGSTAHNITYSVDSQGIVTASGTSDGQSISLCPSYTLPSGTYIVSGAPSDSTLGDGDIYVQRLSDSASIARSYEGAPQSQTTFTLDTDTIIRLGLRGAGSSGQTINRVFKPMIRLATETDATFEPYSNICPISGWDGLNLTVNDYFDKADLSDATSIIKYCPIKVGDGNFTMSTTCLAGGGNTAALFFLPGNVTSGQSSSTNGVWSGRNRSCDAVNGYVTVAYRTVDVINPNNYVSHIYHTDNIYETYTATFDETIMGGSYDFVSGKGPANKGMVDLGDLEWEEHGTYDSVFYAIVPEKKTANSNVICSQLKNGGTFVDYSVLLEGQVYSWVGVLTPRIAIKDTNYETAADFKAAMSGVQLCYEVSISTPISLTGQKIGTVKGTNIVSTDGDSVEVNYHEIANTDDIKILIDETVGTALNTEY